MLAVWAAVSGCTRGPEPHPLPDPAAVVQPDPAATRPGSPPPTTPGDSPAARPTVERPTTGATAATAATTAPGPPSAGGLTWTAPAPLAARTPKSRMRTAEYGVAGTGGAGDAELTVFYFGAGQGGRVQANIDRWVGQMKDPDGTPAEATPRERKVGGIGVSTLDVRGTSSGGMGGAGPREGSRMLAAVAVGPQGPVFFKLIGPEATVDRAEEAFEGLINSLH